jgi:hypothetical protein
LILDFAIKYTDELFEEFLEKLLNRALSELPKDGFEETKTLKKYDKS